MFSKSIKRVRSYTYPVVIKKRYANHSFNSIVYSNGTFTVLNPMGWIITAAHLLKDRFSFEKGTKAEEIEVYKNKIEPLVVNHPLEKEELELELEKDHVNKGLLVYYSEWWGNSESKLVDISVDWDLDIAIGRLEPFTINVKYFPTFISDQKLQYGTSLCTAGFPGTPFHTKMDAYFDSKKRTFHFSEGALPIPLHLTQGIYTGEIEKEGSNTKVILSTSGSVRGQSGGPIFDPKGNVWSINTAVRSFDLGYNADVLNSQKQFAHLNFGPMPGSIRDFLKDNKVKFASTDSILSQIHFV
ncbi:trypsin-like peptidase domain-containing protein [Neobacillus sp. MM2021_6]|uniref:trypsin-like peptidase domain-containing protein n=1 Tax=Bacillaceae TaxID=186817 RepID=UPI00140BC64B|nr:MULTISPECIES: trypsin-like peptidase domain-containing protein [Bacillaceae]MBO0960013.1 trypsin-like peptidase domain-containing protein [Neobacillus sp. MM2021_6]NHC18665.1 trypsin-like peptidase domain-containing protein [Bacillus sp. MM2020_4]